ncbi:glycoside hydrolase family 45 protein [Lactarius quietus]|nr:glycoside hydrolase family 45 protein [Lactarius quietus]
MKSALVLLSSLLLVGAVHGSALLKARTQGDYVQNPSGKSSFSIYSNCSAAPACGKTASGYTAALNQLSYGAGPNEGPGDACGRCFKLTGSSDPNSPNSQGPFNSIVVKVNDLCSAQDNQQLCSQTTSNDTNSLGQPMHFQLCQDSGAPGAFFPDGSETLIGSYQEVTCTTDWTGSDGSSLSDGACFADDNTGFWPSTTGCGNKGAAIGP